MVMTDHLTLCVDHLVSPESLQSLQKVDASGTAQGSCSKVNGSSSFPIDIDEEEDNVAAGEEEPLIQTVECRICQEEDSINNLEVPCSCNGSLKSHLQKFEYPRCHAHMPPHGLDPRSLITKRRGFAHRKCVQRWCNEKGDITCEICHQPYQSGYTAPPPRAEDTTIDISGAWTIAGSPLDLHDPRLLAMAAAEHRLLEAEYDEYDDSDANGAAFCRSAALILMALLLLRHALTMGDSDSDDDDASTFFALFLLRAAGFLLPCYIMAWAISVLQRRRQRQEAAALAASDVAFMIQTGQHRGLQVTIAAGPPVTPAPASTSGPVLSPHQEPVQ